LTGFEEAKEGMLERTVAVGFDGAHLLLVLVELVEGFPEDRLDLGHLARTHPTVPTYFFKNRPGFSN
jgi:hypothetical protein